MSRRLGRSSDSTNYYRCVSSPSASTRRRSMPSPVDSISSASFSTTSKPSPIVELREYQLYPEHAVKYMKLTHEAADLRQRLVPLRMFSLPETGGPLLHVATHAYYYQGGLEERDERRPVMGRDPDWMAYLQQCRPCMMSQASTIWVEADLVERFNLLGLKRTEADRSTSVAPPQASTILELRRYQLKLGYDTVPAFLKLYEAGLPSKLQAEGTDPTSELVTVMHTDVGPLNHVLEVWRHGTGMSAMNRSRAAARNAAEWRHAIASIADLAVSFTTAVHKPAAFSPLR
jgi:NIPSNAP